MEVKIKENEIYKINEKVGIYDENGQYSETTTFTEEEKVVFDKNSKNFHVFPRCAKKRELASNLISENRAKILGYLELLKYEEQKIGGVRSHSKKMKIKFKDNEILLFTTGTKIKEINKLYDVDIRQRETVINVIAGFGKKGDISNFYESNNTMYKYITVFYNNAWYTLNFMRMWCDENKTVHCDFNSLQYHRDCSEDGYGLNTNKKGEFEICYPKSNSDGDCHVNSVGNICYNPEISYYPGNGEKEEVHNEAILDNFIKFIKVCDELKTKPVDIIEKELPEKMKEPDDNKK